jgi:glucose/mannose-6-phosphate isomerase
MRDIILNFPKQFEKGISAAENIKIQAEFKSLVVCGMGGSAWPSELLRDWLNFNFPFYLSKNYNLPPQTDKESLVIISSYSGNTEETLNCYQEAKKRNLKIIGITTGGKLKELCQKDNIPVAILPDDIPAPRLGCGYAFSAMAEILNNCGMIENKSREIIEMAEKINPGLMEEEGKILAEKIGNKIPIIYCSDQIKTLAYIWKIRFNENSKIPAFYNYFPELNHEELNAYVKRNDNLFVIILKDEKDDQRLLKRILLTAEIIESKKIPLQTINLSGEKLLEKIFSSIVLADWASYYLAIKNNVDPLRVELIENFKEKLDNK